MAVLTRCDVVLKLKDVMGSALADSAELSMLPRKSQINSGDALYVARPANAPSQPGLLFQSLIYIAVDTPTTPITITYTPGAVAGSEVVTVVGTAITVQISSGVSTAAQIQLKVQASTAASALVYCILSGTSSDTQISAGPSTLAGAFCYMQLAETTTNSQQVIFTLSYTDQSYYNSIVFDPIYIPAQAYLDLSTITTISRG